MIINYYFKRIKVILLLTIILSMIYYLPFAIAENQRSYELIDSLSENKQIYTTCSSKKQFKGKIECFQNLITEDSNNYAKVIKKTCEQLNWKEIGKCFQNAFNALVIQKKQAGEFMYATCSPITPGIDSKFKSKKDFWPIRKCLNSMRDIFNDYYPSKIMEACGGKDGFLDETYIGYAYDSLSVYLKSMQSEVIGLELCLERTLKASEQYPEFGNNFIYASCHNINESPRLVNFDQDSRYDIENMCFKNIIDQFTDVDDGFRYVNFKCTGMHSSEITVTCMNRVFSQWKEFSNSEDFIDNVDILMYQDILDYYFGETGIGIFSAEQQENDFSRHIYVTCSAPIPPNLIKQHPELQEAGVKMKCFQFMIDKFVNPITDAIKESCSRIPGSYFDKISCFNNAFNALVIQKKRGEDLISSTCSNLRTDYFINKYFSLMNLNLQD